MLYAAEWLQEFGLERREFLHAPKGTKENVLIINTLYSGTEVASSMHDSLSRRSSPMPSFKLTLLTTASLLASASMASANVVHASYSETQHYSAKTDWGTHGGTSSTYLKPTFSPNYAFMFSGYSAPHAGDKLTGVQVTLKSKYSGSITLSNTSAASSETVNASLTNVIKTVVPGTSGNKGALKISSSTVGGLVPKATTSGSGTHITTTPGTLGPLTVSEPASATVTATQTSFSPTSLLSAYTHSWTADVGVLGEITITGGANGKAAYNDTATATVIAKYSYSYTTTPVPEPASLGLLGAGLAGTALVRRRRKR